MTRLEELQKAIEEVAEAGVELLRKSQMALDFTSSNPHQSTPKQRPTLAELNHQKTQYELKTQRHMMDPHHVAYTRTNASGTVSNVQAKGAQAPSQTEWKGKKEKLGDSTQAIIGRRTISAISLHEINGTHEGATGALIQSGKKYEAVKHKGNWHLTGNYTTHHVEAKETKPNANAVHEHYPWGRLTKVEGKGVRAVLHPEHQEAIGKLQNGDSTRFKDEQGIDWTAKRNGEHVELKAPSRVSGTALRVKHSDVAAEEADVSYDPQPGDDAPLKNPQERYESAKHQALLDGVHKVGNDLLQNPLMAKHHEEIKTMLGELKANPHPKHAAAVASQLKDMAAASKPSKNAAKDLKAELESDDFGMTEKGGNGRVRMGRDGKLVVYDSYYHDGEDKLAQHVNKWSPGGHMYNYFKDKGYDIEVVGKDRDHSSAEYKGKSGHVAVHLKVTKP